MSWHIPIGNFDIHLSPLFGNVKSSLAFVKLNKKKISFFDFNFISYSLVPLIWVVIQAISYFNSWSAFIFQDKELMFFTGKWDFLHGNSKYEYNGL